MLQSCLLKIWVDGQKTKGYMVTENIWSKKSNQNKITKAMPMLDKVDFRAGFTKQKEDFILLFLIFQHIRNISNDKYVPTNKDTCIYG